MRSSCESGHEDNAIDAAQNQLAAGVIKYLAGTV